MMTPRWGIALVTALLFSSAVSHAQEQPTPAAILQDLRSFREMGSVLYVAAHPDDENTLLIAYLARGKNYRTAYLSVTRGDGGQNVLGPDFDEKLGVARTQELLAARRLDGGRQFFTRAIDFGFSKDYRETLNIWGKDDVLSDVVRVIRTFRPDVVIDRFSTQPGGTHGHHTASAVLANEAFKLAGDPKAYPDQLKTLQPWQPKRILVNGRGGGDGTLRMEIDGNDPVSGLSFTELAARSRAMHKTQGFDNFGRGNGGPRTETFQVLAGEPATNDIFEGIDTTWGRIPGGANIGKLADDIITQFNSENPTASVPALLKLHKQLAALKSADPLVAEKYEQLDRIIQHCVGLQIETTIFQAEFVPGETLVLHTALTISSNAPSMRWIETHFPSLDKSDDKPMDLRPNSIASRYCWNVLPKDTALTQPYWLRQEKTPGLFHVDDPSLIGLPENPPVVPIQQIFEIDGERLVLADQPVNISKDSSGKEIRRKLDVIPPVSIHFNADVALFAPNASHPMEIEITAARPNTSGTLQLDTPDGWKASPAKQSFKLANAGDKIRLTFTITAPSQSTTAKIGATAEVNGSRWRNDRMEISYKHIPLQLLQPPAAVKCVSLDLNIHGGKIGYLPGAGDNIEACLKQMGCKITELTTDDLTPERLKEFDAVVTGVRLFDTHRDLGSKLSALFTYAENGGTVVMQYNRVDGLQSAPLTLKISQDRVTDEHAPVTFLAPDSPVLNSPNKITNADFDNWVQERGTYFPNQWDQRFTPILACNDPGESPLKGGLLVADYGKGHFVYTGLAFFRQLPAGVPGAYRLFANLISLGK